MTIPGRSAPSSPLRDFPISPSMATRLVSGVACLACIQMMFLVRGGWLILVALPKSREFIFIRGQTRVVVCTHILCIFIKH